jgi:hypothetical protein
MLFFPTDVLHEGWTNWVYDSFDHALLPDILFYDPRQPARYPHNGRTLTDDVADVFFSMYTNRNMTDRVGPHRDLLDEFPYLGLPHDQRLDANF